MVIKDDEWDELAINKNRRRSKKKKFKNLEHQKDAEFSHFEEKRFVETLENSSGKYSWMKEKRYKSMFRDIEGKIQGAIGKGSFEWVDRRVFDQVFDRLTLMSLYKLMKNGVIETFGVQEFILSDSQKVVAKPFNGLVQMKEGRDMDFNGVMSGGFCNFTGMDFHFIYEILK